MLLCAVQTVKPLEDSFLFFYFGLYKYNLT